MSKDDPKPLKVFMMGGRRCGKTSVLASMFDRMTNGIANKYFTVADATVHEMKDGEIQDSLDGKINELKDFLGKPNNKTFIVDANPTNKYWDYFLKLQIPGSNRNMKMQFRDSSGEFFVAGTQLSVKTESYVKECDVFIVAIDTPYLMGATEDGLMDICTEGKNLVVNRVQDIQRFLTNIRDNGGKDAKMVIFVPIKCEKWVNEGRVEDVNARIKEVYGTMIQNLSAYKKMSIAIIPILTAGNIIFEEFKEPLTIKLPKYKEPIKCCPLGKETFRLADGKIYRKGEADLLLDDPKAVIEGTNLLRPYAWYRINKADSSFSPQNCEQLPLHILRFMLSKVKEAEQKQDSGFFSWLFNKLLSVFGGLDIEEIEGILKRMADDGVIKDDKDGIEYIKRCY